MSRDDVGQARDTARGSGAALRRLPALLLEAAMVVFAVLVALGVEEWREGRQRAEFAARVRASVEREIEANLDEFETSGVGLERTARQMAEALRAEDVSLLRGHIELTLPDFSSAAWRAAQASEVTRELDFDWLIDVSRAYEAYDTYRRIGDAVIDKLSDVMVGDPTLDEIAAVQGRLLILVSVHGQVVERLELVGLTRGSASSGAS